jgi:hypothetical protein
MTIAYLKYDLNDGYIDNWLVAGPFTLADQDTPPASGTWPPPVENGIFQVGEHALTWNYYRCRDDHRVDFSDRIDTNLTVIWAYTQVVVEVEQTAAFTLTCPNRVTLSLNGALIFSADRGQQINTIALKLTAGMNEILVCASDVWLDNGLNFKLRWPAAPAATHVQIPTAAPRPDRREKFERVLPQAYLDRDVYTRSAQVVVHWPPQSERTNVLGRMQHESGRIYAEATRMLDAETHTLTLNKALNIPDGRYEARLMPAGEEYYSGLRYDRRLPFYVSTGTYSAALYGTDEQRRTEALAFAADQGTGLYAEIAKMALDRWDAVQWGVVDETLAEADRFPRNRSALFRGLRRIFWQFGDHVPPPTRSRLLAWMEANPDSLSADDHLRNLHRQGTGMQSELGPLTEQIVRLAHLADFAESTALSELAAVSLDQVLFSLAVNSFQGTFSAPRAAANGLEVINGRLQPTAGISRMLCGTGIYNEHIAGLVTLACSDYAVPSLIQAIALDQPESMWSRQKSADAATVTYKTPDYLLASAQAFFPGQPGSSQLIWQATLSPDAMVFTNHPARSRDLISPGFWWGSAILPRVGQWHDALIAIYNASDDTGLDYTHAYFPLWAFDEHVIEDKRAFARVGDGYLALRSANRFRLVTAGDSAYRELRAPGRQNVWVCHLGSARQDGGFADFQTRIRQLDLTINGLTVTMTTLRGDVLRFGWADSLRVNGVEHHPADFKLCENAYCVAEIGDTIQDIHYQDYVMRLNFEID